MLLPHSKSRLGGISVALAERAKPDLEVPASARDLAFVVLFLCIPPLVLLQMRLSLPLLVRSHLRPRAAVAIRLHENLET